MTADELTPSRPRGAPARAAVDPGRHEWERFAVAWHAGFFGLAALTAVLVTLDDGVTTGRRDAAYALTAALCLAYVLLGMRHDQSGRGHAYVPVAAVLTLALFAVAPVGSLMLFALYPHMWRMLSPRRAIVAMASVVAGVSIVAVGRAGVDSPEVATWLVIAAVTLGAGLLLGLWIARIIRQSQRRADLLAELASTRAELEAVSREAGRMAERERLAYEIHDTLAQGFTSVLLLLEAADRGLDTDAVAARQYLRRARDTASDNLAEARALVAALTPPDLTRTSLPEALRRIVDRAAEHGPPEVVLTVSGAPRGLAAERDVALLRAAQEALTNVRRHAAARRVEVRLEYGPSAVTLSVVDDGCGFDPVAAAGEGYGLSGMRARAHGIGGTVTVVTAPGDGTTVRFDLPVDGSRS